MSAKHSNISVFVPHMGCPHRCSFCNQVTISGETEIPNAATVINAVETAVKSGKCNSKTTEIAFFGGSFTAIEKSIMLELLSAAKKYVKNGTVKGIRISTRPDCIDSNILQILKEYGVTAIELGAQSMDDSVLKANGRGHNAQAVVNASRLIKQSGFELGLQMMIGLIGDTPEKCFETAQKIAEIGPKTVRIYPAIVLKGTYLEKLVLNKSYTPVSVDAAVEMCKNLVLFFNKHNITVIRTGLHSIDESQYVAGPWHPAFGELCESAIMLDAALNLLKNQPKGNYVIYTSKNNISKMIGQKKQNLQKLRLSGYNCTVKPSTNIKDILTIEKV